MKIKSILISQPTPQFPDKSPYHQLQVKYNVENDFYPFIRVEGVSLREFKDQRVDVLDYTAVIFTSRTAVDNFFRICDEAKITVPESMKFLCSSEVLALYLQKYIVYRKRKIMFAEGSFASMMELLIKNKKEKQLLILSQPHKADLPEVMEKLNLDFGKVILSKTLNNDLSKIDISKYNLLALFTSGDVESLTAQYSAGDLPMLITFGDSATAAAIAAGLKVSAMAPIPEAPSMAKAIELFIGKVNEGESVAPIEFVESNEAQEFLDSFLSKGSKKRKK